MMKKQIIALLALITIGFVPTASMASELIDGAKAKCLVGEQANGYLGLVPGKQVSADVRREMRRVNQQRKSVYAGLARKNNVTEEVAAALTAEKLLKRAKPGHCVRGANGEWKKR